MKKNQQQQYNAKTIQNWLEMQNSANNNVINFVLSFFIKKKKGEKKI